MSEFEIIKSCVEQMVFRPDGTYNTYYYTDFERNIICAPQELIENIESKVNAASLSIVDGDVVLFKESSFPKLFLKEINSKITRTIKAEKATKIVTDSKNLITSADVKNIEKITLLRSSTNQYYYVNKDAMCECGVSLSKFTADNNLEVIEDCWLVPNTITSKKLKMLDSYDKIATTENLTGYLNNYLPLPTPEQKETLLALLASDEKENMELGINMVRMFNISDCIFDIFSALAGDNHYNSGEKLKKINRNNVRWKYLMSIADANLSKFRHFHYCSYYRDNVIISKLYNLPFISLEQKRKCWIQAYVAIDWGRWDNRDNLMQLAMSGKCKAVDRRMLSYGFPEKFSDIS